MNHRGNQKPRAVRAVSFPANMNTFSLEQHLEDLNRRVEQSRRDKAAFMATQPQTIPCRVHPDCRCQIDEQATNFGQLKAGYAPCPECSIADQRKVDRERLKSLGVPEILVDATFENFSKNDGCEAGHVDEVKSFCEKKRGFLIMLGAYGTGKSHLAVAALRVFDRGWFTKQSSLLSALRATYRDKTAFDPKDRAQSAQLFVLDDVGVSSGGRDELPLLHEILDYRHGERLPTIITSNLPWENLTSALGERMGDRLRESTFRVLTFAGLSHRRDARGKFFV